MLTVEQSPPLTQTTPPPLIQEPPPDNGNVSIIPQAEETVANNHPPAQTQHTGTETFKQWVHETCNSSQPRQT